MNEVVESDRDYLYFIQLEGGTIKWLAEGMADIVVGTWEGRFGIVHGWFPRIGWFT